MIHHRNPNHRPHTLATLLPLAVLVVAAVLPFALAPALPAQLPTPSVEALRKNFVNPPNEARPMVRWWWFGLAVVKPEILRELQQMKADGIQGAELAFEYPQVLDDPAKGLNNLPFLSPEMLDDVKYAQEEGRKLGLRIDLTLCSGWPYGGPSVTLAEASTRLRTAEIPVAADATSVVLPKLRRGRIAYLSRHCRSVNSWSHPQPFRAAVEAAAAARGRASFDAFHGQADHRNRRQRCATRIQFKPRIAVFFILSHTKQQVKRAAVGAEGYVLDSFSHEAVANYLRKVGQPLIGAFGDTPPYAIFSDSLEAYGSDWTPNLPAEFKKRRGYDLIPHLPELVAGGTPAAETDPPRLRPRR